MFKLNSEINLNFDNMPLLRSNAKGAARVMRLPFHRQVWRGAHGNWSGAGVGSSIDFHDHRPYAPGDDPRLINWQAYARTGQYSMKLFREEVSPGVDIVLDCSQSMFFESAKGDRVLEIFYFAIESAFGCGSSIRLFAATGRDSAPLDLHALLGNDLGQLGKIPSAGAPLDLGSLLFRQYSLRVLISDLLFPGSPSGLLRQLARGKGRGIILVPFSPAESDPRWTGNYDLVDCETGRTKKLLVDGSALARYRSSYSQHFELWRDGARPHGIALARIPAEGTLPEALKIEGLVSGAVEPRL